MLAYMHVCMYEYVHLCMYVCTYVCMYVHIKCSYLPLPLWHCPTCMLCGIWAAGSLGVHLVIKKGL